MESNPPTFNFTNSNNAQQPNIIIRILNLNLLWPLSCNKFYIDNSLSDRFEDFLDDSFCIQMDGIFPIWILDFFSNWNYFPFESVFLFEISCIFTSLLRFCCYVREMFVSIVPLSHLKIIINLICTTIFFFFFSQLSLLLICSCTSKIKMQKKKSKRKNWLWLRCVWCFDPHYKVEHNLSGISTKKTEMLCMYVSCVYKHIMEISVVADIKWDSLWPKELWKSEEKKREKNVNYPVRDYCV